MALRSVASRAAALAAGLLFAAAGAVSSATAAEPLKIRIAWSTMPTHLIPALYVKKDVLKHYGKSYVVDPIQFRGSSPQLTALAAREIDLATLGPAPFALGVLNARLDLKIVADVFQDGAPGHLTMQFLVRNDSGIASVRDLKGKRVATNAIGSTADTAIRAMLHREGMDPQRDVSILEVGFPNMQAMLESGRVDLVSGAQPFTGRMLQTGSHKILFDAGDAFGTPTQGVMLAARARFLEENKAAMQDFFEDHVRAVRWFLEPANREEAVKIVAGVMKTEPARLSSFLTKDDYYRDPWLRPNVEGVQKVLDYSVAFGFIPKNIKAADYVDMTFLDEAKRRIQP